MAKLIGTAGHVDHGKTTLIRALTGIDADRLPEEKSRGMTIDIGFAYLDFPGVGRVSIVDVPGHERFIHNMLVGALGINVALLCVAADEGVKPQTREHLQILELLPVEHMVVALTRADLADSETRELAQLDVADLLQSTRFADSPIVPTSAETGEGLDELKEALALSLKASAESKTAPWYLPIDRAFTVKGQGSVVTGALAQGQVKTGDVAVLQPGNQETRVRAIHVHNESVEKAEYGQRVALNLGGVKLEDLKRGQIVSQPGAAFETRILDGRVRWIAPVKHSLRIRLSIGAEEAIGRIFLNNEDSEIVQIRLEQDIACAREQSFILRQYSPPILLGGGTVLLPQAQKRRKNEKASLAEINMEIDKELLEIINDNANGVPTETLCRLTARTPQELGNVLEDLSKSGQVVGLGGRWLPISGFEDVRDRLLEALLKVHELQPTKLWQQRDPVLKAANISWAGKPLDRFLSRLSPEYILVNGTQIRTADFRVKLTDKQDAFLSRVSKELDEAGLNPPGIRHLARNLSVPPQAVEEILKLGVESGLIVRLPEDIFFSAPQIDVVKAKVKELFGDKQFTAAEFRDQAGTSRKYAIPILEYLDSVRFTLRQGDKRVVSQP